jgi:hypothetical protein
MATSDGDGFVDLIGSNSSGPITILEGYEEQAPGPCSCG